MQIKSKEDGIGKHEGKKLLVLMFCLFALCIQMSAQESIFKGVISGDNHKPIIGASVVVKNTKSGTVTDALGRFSLTVPAKGGFTLVISGVGFFQKEVPMEMIPNYVPYTFGIVVKTYSRSLKEVGNDTSQKYKPTEGKEVFSITISRNNQDVLKLDGGGTVFAATDKNKTSILLKSPGGDPVSLYIFGTTSGDYKFPDGPSKGGPKTGDAMFQLIPSSNAAKNEFKSGYVLGTGGIIHLTIANGTCSGNFEATVSFLNKGAISDIQYKAIGSFNNIPLKSKSN